MFWTKTKQPFTRWTRRITSTQRLWSGRCLYQTGSRGRWTISSCFTSTRRQGTLMFLTLISRKEQFVRTTSSKSSTAGLCPLLGQALPIYDLGFDYILCPSRCRTSYISKTTYRLPFGYLTDEIRCLAMSCSAPLEFHNAVSDVTYYLTQSNLPSNLIQ